MKIYELTYIVSPDITSEEAGAKGKEMESAITSGEGTVLKQSSPVAKTFSHPVGRKASGFLGVLEFNLEPEKVVELQEMLNKDDKVVRHMLIIKEAAEFKKERRTRVKPEIAVETKQETAEPATVLEGFGNTEEKASEPAQIKPVSRIKEIKEKVELKDIEQELDEILG